MEKRSGQYANYPCSFTLKRHLAQSWVEQLEHGNSEVQVHIQKLAKYQTQEEECKSLTKSTNAKHGKSHSPIATMSHDIVHEKKYSKC